MMTIILSGLLAGTVLGGSSGFGSGGSSGFGSGGLGSGKMGETKPVESPAMFDPQIREMYQQAVALLRQRKYDDAEEICQQILARKPKEPNTEELLRQIGEMRWRAPAADPAAALRLKLKTIVLPEFKADDAVAQNLIGHLQDQSAKFGADKKPVNLVWNVPAAEKVRPVTLHLFKVSLADVLKFVTEVCGLQCRWDEHAVVIAKTALTTKAASTEDQPGRPASAALKQKLKTTVIPEFVVSDAAAREALTHLQQVGGKAAADQTPINLVWNVPPERVVPTVTLALYNLPMADALQYATEVAGLRYRVDERAVVILPPAEPPPASAGSARQ
jgi:hypothetical protein